MKSGLGDESRKLLSCYLTGPSLPTRLLRDSLQSVDSNLGMVGVTLLACSSAIKAWKRGAQSLVQMVLVLPLAQYSGSSLCINKGEHVG